MLKSKKKHFLFKCSTLEEKRAVSLIDIYLEYKNDPLLNTSLKFARLMGADDPYIMRNIIKLLLALFSFLVWFVTLRPNKQL